MRVVLRVLSWIWIVVNGLGTHYALSAALIWGELC